LRVDKRKPFPLRFAILDQHSADPLSILLKAESFAQIHCTHSAPNLPRDGKRHGLRISAALARNDDGMGLI
jgi:hypothetical protein